jgi:hypothetical protein
MSDGASIYLCTTNDEVIDLVSRGQGVFGIAIGRSYVKWNLVGRFCGNRCSCLPLVVLAG